MLYNGMLWYVIWYGKLYCIQQGKLHPCTKTGKAIRPIKHKNLKDDLTKKKKSMDTGNIYGYRPDTAKLQKKNRTG